MRCQFCHSEMVHEENYYRCPRNDCPSLMKKLSDFWADAAFWECQCGMVADPLSANWRWSGTAWQHHHGYPMGHVDAIKVNK